MLEFNTDISMIFILLLIPNILFGVFEYPFDKPLYNIKEFETENFYIVYSDAYEQPAFLAARIAEEEFQSLSTIYGSLQHFQKKIRLVVSSEYQIANGLASAFILPVSHIYVGVPPSIDSSHSFTGNTLRGLIRHELTHIFTLSSSMSTNNFVRYLASTYNTTPAVSALSFIEGSAVLRESDFGQGRLNDPLGFQHIRRDLLDGYLKSFDQIGGQPTLFGRGSAPYLYGAYIYEYITKNYSSEFEKKYWKEAAKLSVSAGALKKLTKKHPNTLFIEFTNDIHKKIIKHTTNKTMFLPEKKRRINSMQKIKDTLYYFNIYDKTVHALNLKTKKNKLIAYGYANWETISISPDEKYILVSGIASKKRYVNVLTLKGLVPMTKPFFGLKNASFLPDSTKENIHFTATDISGDFANLVIVNNENKKTIFTGTPEEYPDSPVSHNGTEIYFLHNYKGTPLVSRIDLKTSVVKGFPTIKNPRFLMAFDNSISVSYAEDRYDFYKTALVERNNIRLIRDNIKGDMLGAVIYDDELIYRSSFAESDNILSTPITRTAQRSLNTAKTLQKTTFTPVPKPKNIKKFNPHRDIFPAFIIPSISLQRAGIMTMMFDSTGANFINTGLNFDYIRGTPEFNFSWKHTSTPIDIELFIQNFYVRSNSIFNLGEHHVVSTGLNFSEYKSFATLSGSYSYAVGIRWLGRFTGDTSFHPYYWNTMSEQQLIGYTSFSVQQSISEGSYGFNRSIALSLRNKINFLNTFEYSLEGRLSFSPPILPITVNFYSAYDTTKISSRGTSKLGNSIVPYYNEYSNLSIFNKLVLFWTANIQLYSWEIHNGIGFGELFFKRWSFHTGYRGGLWGFDQPYLHSVYLNTYFDFSLLYNYIPITLFVELSYAITTSKIGYDLGLSINVPI